MPVSSCQSHKKKIHKLPSSLTTSRGFRQSDVRNPCERYGDGSLHSVLIILFVVAHLGVEEILNWAHDSLNGLKWSIDKSALLQLARPVCLTSWTVSDTGELITREQARSLSGAELLLNLAGIWENGMELSTHSDKLADEPYLNRNVNTKRPSEFINLRHQSWDRVL